MAGEDIPIPVGDDDAAADVPPPPSADFDVRRTLETVMTVQQAHEVPPGARVTRRPSKYLDIWDLLDDQRKYSVPTNPIAYAALKTFTLQKIGKAWRDHKCRLKNMHYILNSRNKALVKKNRPKGCILEDCDVLVKHWNTDEAVIESEKNKDRRSKQDDLHFVGSCSFAVHSAKKAKTDGHLVECAALYPILQTRKNGSAVNPAVQAKLDKMKELLADPFNQLQSSDTSDSIAWLTDDMNAQVMYKERKGFIRE
nr:hypothetical protein CFP56_62987 [Quercus suber]